MIESVIAAGIVIIGVMLGWAVLYPVLCIFVVMTRVFYRAGRDWQYRRRWHAWMARQPLPIQCGPYRTDGVTMSDVDALKRLAKLERREERRCMAVNLRGIQCETPARWVAKDGFRVCVDHATRIEGPLDWFDGDAHE